MPQYLVGRVTTGLAAGQTMVAMPTYFSEVSPPNSRGLMAGAHGSGINIGYAIAGWVGWVSLDQFGNSDAGGRTMLIPSRFGCFFESNSSFVLRELAFLAGVKCWGLIA
jgi:MFS family permease